MLMSMVMTSGLRESARVTASRPSFAWPTTSSDSSDLMMFSRTLRINAESSTIRTRNFLLATGGMGCSGDRDRSHCLRSNELFNGSDELIFLHRLGEERCSAFLDRAVAMFCAGARGDDHHGDAARRWILS